MGFKTKLSTDELIRLEEELKQKETNLKKLHKDQAEINVNTLLNKPERDPSQQATDKHKAFLESLINERIRKKTTENPSLPKFQNFSAPVNLVQTIVKRKSIESDETDVLSTNQLNNKIVLPTSSIQGIQKVNLSEPNPKLKIFKESDIHFSKPRSSSTNGSLLKRIILPKSGSPNLNNLTAGPIMIDGKKVLTMSKSVLSSNRIMWVQKKSNAGKLPQSIKMKLTSDLSKSLNLSNQKAVIVKSTFSPVPTSDAPKIKIEPEEEITDDPLNVDTAMNTSTSQITFTDISEKPPIILNIKTLSENLPASHISSRVPLILKRKKESDP